MLREFLSKLKEEPNSSAEITNKRVRIGQGGLGRRLTKKQSRIGKEGVPQL